MQYWKKTITALQPIWQNRTQKQNFLWVYRKMDMSQRILKSTMCPCCIMFKHCISLSKSLPFVAYDRKDEVVNCTKNGLKTVAIICYTPDKYRVKWTHVSHHPGKMSKGISLVWWQGSAGFCVEVLIMSLPCLIPMWVSINYNIISW